MINISILVPTRKRPEWLGRLIGSLVLNTRDISRVELILRIDEGDNSYESINYQGINVKKIYGAISTMGAYNSECLYASSGDIIVLLNDDVVVRTLNWDDRVNLIHQKFNDGIYLAYGNDLFKQKNLCTFPILSRTTCQLLVNPFPKIYSRGFIDTHLMDIFKRLKAKGINRVIYDPNLVFEHLHFRVGKSAIDSTYNIGRSLRFADDENYLALIKVREDTAKCLLNIIQNRPTAFNVDCNKLNLSKFFLKRCYQVALLFLEDKGMPIGYRINQIIYFIFRDIFRRWSR